MNYTSFPTKGILPQHSTISGDIVSELPKRKFTESVLDCIFVKGHEKGSV